MQRPGRREFKRAKCCVSNLKSGRRADLEREPSLDSPAHSSLQIWQCAIDRCSQCRDTQGADGCQANHVRYVISGRKDFSDGALAGAPCRHS